MAAALQILYDVVAFRMRRLEMANLAGAIAIMIVLRLPASEVAVRTLFGALLNVLVYLNNDYLDVALDGAAPDKDQDKVRFLQAHMGAARAAQYVLACALFALALGYSPGLLVALFGGGGICLAYSAKLKHTPGLDVVAMAAWGFVMPLCGVPLERALGLCLALQLGLFSAVFEPIQVIRDRAADAALSVRTTAVVLGVPRTLQLARALMLVSAAYAALVLHPAAGGLLLLAPLIPFREGRADRYWTAVKLVCGCAWLFACAALYTSGTSAGLLLGIDAESTLNLLRVL